MRVWTIWCATSGVKCNFDQGRLRVLQKFGTFGLRRERRGCDDDELYEALVQTGTESGDDEQMPRFVPVEELFKGRHFDREIVVLCVRWYLSYKLSYRDLVTMMSKTGNWSGPHDDSSMGAALHARVREAMERLCPAGGRFLAV